MFPICCPYVQKCSLSMREWPHLPICVSHMLKLGPYVDLFFAICYHMLDSIWATYNLVVFENTQHMGHIWAAYGPHMGCPYVAHMWPICFGRSSVGCSKLCSARINEGTRGKNVFSIYHGAHKTNTQQQDETEQQESIRCIVRRCSFPHCRKSFKCIDWPEHDARCRCPCGRELLLESWKKNTRQTFWCTYTLYQVSLTIAFAWNCSSNNLLSDLLNVLWKAPFRLSTFSRMIDTKPIYRVPQCYKFS